MGMMIWVAVGCSQGHSPAPSASVLVRVGHRSLTTQAFDQIFELETSAYAIDDLENPDTLRRLKERVMGQVIEELTVENAADDLGIRISDKELNAQVARVRADYPDSTFDEMLLESAIPFDAWRDRLRARMRIARTVDKVVADAIRVTPEDIATYYRDHLAGKIPDPGSAQVDARVLREVRSAKKEEAYAKWLAEARKRYPATVEPKAWALEIGAEPRASRNPERPARQSRVGSEPEAAD